MLAAAYPSLFHFHMHVQRHRNGDFAGPGFGDVNYADNTRANCLVFTFVRGDAMNVDFYRHGRVLVDLGVIVPKDASLLTRTHAPGDEAIVEWRALTIQLLDRIVEPVGNELGVKLTMPQVLEGGTWSAGRRIAAEKRAGGAPPVRVVSDGTGM